jgi:hypothetical protein
MNALHLITTAAAALSLTAPAATYAAVQRITVPAHLEYCVTSKSLSASAYELPEVREALFQLLYKQIEQAALEAALPSTGVAFVDAVTPGADTQAAAAGVPAGAPPSTYVVRECAIVPARGTPPLPASGVREVAVRVLYATICTPASIEACKRDLEKVVRQENSSPAELARPIIWRTRQALSTDDSTANLVASMSDSTLRVLREPAPPLKVPENVVVVSAELGTAGN